MREGIVIAQRRRADEVHRLRASPPGNEEKKREKEGEERRERSLKEKGPVAFPLSTLRNIICCVRLGDLHTSRSHR